MKNCIVLSILLSLFTTARAQENTGPTHHFGISLGANYLFPFDNDLNVGVKETGFNGSVTYTLQQGKIGFQLSPFGKLHSGEDFDAMKQYYKDKGVTLNSFNSGTYLSTGMDAGLQFVLVDNGKLPVFKTYIQYGISSVRVPEINFTSESEQDGNVNVRADGGLGLGSNLQFGVICDVFMPDGSPFEGDPRGILKRQLERVKKMGYVFNVGPELEFFLLKKGAGFYARNSKYRSSYFN